MRLNRLVFIVLIPSILISCKSPKNKWQGTIDEIDEVFDVSPVTFPAYDDTTVALRSLDKAKANKAAGDESKVHIEIHLKGMSDLSLADEFT